MLPTQVVGENVWNWVEGWQTFAFWSTIEAHKESKTVSEGFGGVFPCFRGSTFFQNFRHDFSRFLHIWPIFRVGENGKNVKNLDHEKPDPRYEFKAWERFIEALSGKKGFFFMTFMKKIFDHLGLDMVKKIVKFFGRGRWAKKSGDLKEENSFSKFFFTVRLAY